MGEPALHEGGGAGAARGGVAARIFIARGFADARRRDAAMEFLASVLPMAVGSVDRLEEIPDRLAFLFDFDAAAALGAPEVAEVMREPGAREVDRRACRGAASTRRCSIARRSARWRTG